MAPSTASTASKASTPPQAGGSDPRLGRLVRRAEASPLSGWLIFGLGLGLLLTWVVLATLMGLDQLSRARSAGTFWVGPLVMAFVFVPLGLIFAVKGWRGRVHRLDVHERGLAFQDRAGRVVVPWDQIIGVYWAQFGHIAKLGLGVDLQTHRSAKLSVVSVKHKPIVVDERLPGHVELAAFVRDAAAAGMRARTLGAIEQGHRLFFGPLGVDSGGLYLGSEHYPWNQISRVTWQAQGQQAWYSIQGEDGAILRTVDDAAVFNQILLRELLDQYGKY
jgi:hypothetical protein